MVLARTEVKRMPSLRKKLIQIATKSELVWESSPFFNSNFNNDQLELIMYGLEMELTLEDMNKFANPEFSVEEMEYILENILC